jgi:hypothetical protein
MSFAYILCLLIIYLIGRPMHPDGKNTLTYRWRNWFPTLPSPLSFVSSVCTEAEYHVKKDKLQYVYFNIRGARIRVLHFFLTINIFRRVMACKSYIINRYMNIMLKNARLPAEFGAKG